MSGRKGLNCTQFGNLNRSTACNSGVPTGISPGELKSLITETKCDLAYNDYLQSLMKYQIINQRLKEQEDILNGQIQLQQDNLSKKTDVLKQIKSDTDRLIMMEEIVKMIKTLEENISNIQRIYSNYQTQKHMENVQVALQEKTKVITLKNVQPIVTQKQYESLIESLKKLISACEKFINCGRDFEGVHNLAENCKQLSQIVKKIKESQLLLSTMETEAITTILQKLSDAFAKKYENIDH